MEQELHPQKKSKGRRSAELLGLILLFIFITVVTCLLYRAVMPKKVSYDLRACPLDAMQCPDGSYIGRTGLHCKFDCSKKMGAKKTVLDAGLLFQRTASWGPCLLPDPNACHDELTLSQEGSLNVSSVKGSVDEKISTDNLEKIKTHIRSSDLLHKACEAPETLDYAAHYRIILDGVTRDIDFPGCEADLKAIDNILNS